MLRRVGGPRPLRAGRPRASNSAYGENANGIAYVEAASMRYVHARGRLREILAELPGFASGSSPGI